jgi:hypothetical protein
MAAGASMLKKSETRSDIEHANMFVKLGTENLNKYKECASRKR